MEKIFTSFLCLNREPSLRREWVITVFLEDTEETHPHGGVKLSELDVARGENAVWDIDLPSNTAALVIEALHQTGAYNGLQLVVRYKYCDNTFRCNPYHHRLRNHKLMAGYNWVTIEL